MRFPFELIKDREFDVLGFGTNAVDFLIQVPSYPEFNSKIELLDHIQAPGGEVATTMAGLSRLGVRTIYAGRFGSDPSGELGRRSLEIEGVDLRFAESIDGATTQVAFIIIDARNGERTVLWKRDQKLAYRPDDAPVNAIEKCGVLHITPHDTDACIKMAETAREQGVIVSIDIDREFQNVDKLLPLVDILIVSSEFPREYLGLNDLENALKQMQIRYGCSIVGVTLGETGSLLLANDEYIRTAGFEVPGGCMDTTGAGDAFRVGLLYGLINGDTLENSAKMANAVAALKCRQIGARTALPTREELYSLIED